MFYCRDNIENIRAMEYYRQDIEAFKSLGHEVVVCNRYRDIPWSFDVMYIWWWTYALFPVLFATLRGRKSIITGVFNFRFPDKTYGADYFSRPAYQRFLIASATKLANLNLFISEREFNDVPSYFGLKNSFYFPCAVGDEYFDVVKNDALRQGALNLAWSGTENLKRKGVWDIVRAAEILNDRGVAFSFSLAGKQGDAFLQLKQYIHAKKLEGSVKILGEISKEEKLKLFSQSRLYLQPSYFEGFGLATAEAMAAGCCVITCDVGEVRNVVGDGGVYVAPGNPAELAEAIESLLKDDEKVLSVKRRAAKRLNDLFSFSRKKERLNEILRIVF